MSPSGFDPGPLAHVECHPSGTRSTLVFVRDLRHPPEKVWAALTDPKHLEQWAPFTPDGSLASPGPRTLRLVDGTTVEESPAMVTRAIAPTLLEYTWGDDVLTWEIAPHGSGTRITLRHTVDSSDWIPRVAAGWHLCLVVAERLLDGRPVGRIVGSEAKRFGWDAIHDQYAALLGIPGPARPEGARPGA